MSITTRSNFRTARLFCSPAWLKGNWRRSCSCLSHRRSQRRDTTAFRPHLTWFPNGEPRIGPGRNAVGGEDGADEEGEERRASKPSGRSRRRTPALKQEREHVFGLRDRGCQGVATNM